MAQPIQNMLSLNACLGKPVGHRTVCKTPMLYRHLNRARSLVSQWEVKHRQSYDTAIKGSAALTAALSRNLNIEMANRLGLVIVLALLDMAKFFDTIDPNVVIQSATEN